MPRPARTLEPITEESVEELAGDDPDAAGQDEADLEPDRDDSDFEEPPAEFTPTVQQQKDLQ